MIGFMFPSGILRGPEGSIANGNICLMVRITDVVQLKIIPMYVCAWSTEHDQGKEEKARCALSRQSKIEGDGERGESYWS